MFDIGFFELALIGLVLLIVMGPEKLPDVARQGAFVVRKLRLWLTDMKSEMNAHDSEGMASLNQATREISELKASISQIGQDVMTEVKGVGEDMQGSFESIEDELIEADNGYSYSEYVPDYVDPELLDDDVAGKPEEDTIKKPAVKASSKKAKPREKKNSAK